MRSLYPNLWPDVYWLIYLLKHFTIKPICQININQDCLQESQQNEKNKQTKRGSICKTLECLKFDVTRTGPTDGALCGLTEFWSGSPHHSQVLSPEDCMHAVSQGALAVECRAGDEATLQMLSELQDLDTALSCVAERAFLRKLVGALTLSTFITSEYYRALW